MKLTTYFADFLSRIRLTENQIKDCRRGHSTLRQRLSSDESLGTLLVSTFLQGSYRRATAIRPSGEERADVDVVVVTTLNKDDCTPQEALELFVPFLNKHYRGKYRIQGRSIGIALSYVDLDLVVTAAPAEEDLSVFKWPSVTTEETPEDVSDWRLTKSWIPASERGSPYACGLLEKAKQEEEWKLSPLFIPDREAKKWEPTHPLAQMQWTWAKNARCNGHYVNVVKCLKWWRRVRHPEPEHPKGYPLEHLIGCCCPDGISSVAEGVTLVLEAIATGYSSKPVLPDHGVPEHDVMARVSNSDYAKFYEQVCMAAELTREALDAETVRDSANAWRELFGSRFPEPPPDEDSQGKAKGGYTPRTGPTVIGGGRFA